MESIIGALLYFIIVPAQETIRLSTNCLLFETLAILGADILNTKGVVDLAQSLKPSLLLHRT